MNTPIRTFVLSLAAFVAITTVAYAAFDPQSWQYYRDLSVPSGSEFVKVTLPDTASRGGNNFADIRIMTDGNVEVPYFLTKNSVMRGGTVSARIVDQVQNNGATSFVMDTGSEGSIHTGLNVDVSSSNFQRRVRVYSASSQLPLGSAAWNLVTDKGFIFRLTDPYTGSVSGKTFVDFPANTARYFKIVIDAGVEGGVTVTSGNVYGETHIDIPVYEKDVAVSTFNNPTRKTTEITIDLGEAGHMTDAVTIRPTDNNYSRRVIVEVADDAAGPWRNVGESSISNVSTPLFTGASNRISYSEQKSRYIRLSIVNDDNRPLTIASMAKVEGPIVSAIFETRPGESYRLYYGNPTARTSTYDIARISSYIEENKLPAAVPGSEMTNPQYVAPAAPLVPFTEKYPWMLNTFLVIVVVLIAAAIGWYLYEYMKKGKATGFTNEEGVSQNEGEEPKL